MAITVREQPLAHHLSGNSVIIELSSTLLNKINHRINLRLKDLSNNNVFAEDSLAVIQGVSTFDISTYVQRRFTDHVFIDDTEHICDILLNYQVEAYETYDYDGLEHDNITVGSYYAHEGKLDVDTLAEWELAGKTFYSEIIQAKKPFLLNTIPETVYYKNTEFLYFWLLVAYRYRIEVTHRWSDNYSDTYVFGEIVPAKDGVFAIPFGFENFISLIAVNPYLSDSSVVLVDFDFKLIQTNYELFPAVDTTIFEITQSVDYTYKKLIHNLFFKNKFGVFQNFQLTGNYKLLKEIDREVQSSAVKKVLSSYLSKFKEASSGWLNTDDFNHLESLVIYSKDIFIYENDRFKPIIIGNKKINEESTEFLKKIELELTYAETDFV